MWLTLAEELHHSNRNEYRHQYRSVGVNIITYTVIYRNDNCCFVTFVLFFWGTRVIQIRQKAHIIALVFGTCRVQLSVYDVNAS